MASRFNCRSASNRRLPTELTNIALPPSSAKELTTPRFTHNSLGSVIERKSISLAICLLFTATPTGASTCKVLWVMDIAG